MKILLVDDCSEIRNSMRMLLSLNYEVIEASSAMEALELLEKLNIRCIVSDVQMPDLSGVELVKQMRQKSINIPVILMTGIQALNTDEIVNISNCQLLLKPFEISELERLIQESV